MVKAMEALPKTWEQTMVMVLILPTRMMTITLKEYLATAPIELIGSAPT